jgi:hypothetical protein
VEYLDADPALARIQETARSPSRFTLWIALPFLLVGTPFLAAAVRITRRDAAKRRP